MLDVSLDGSGLLKLLTEIASKAQGYLKTRLENAQSASKVASLKQYVTDLNEVKTIYQPDKLVRLTEIYFPLEVRFRERVVNPKSVDDILVEKRCVVIQGTAGQGKSLFMRRLCINELGRGEYVPLLVRLRDLRKGETLISLILREFSNLGFDENERLIFYFWKRGLLLLLLDGFDELNSAKSGEVIKELESYIKRYRKTSKIIISSRPNSTLNASYYWESIDLAPLENYQQYRFVEHMMPQGGSKDVIISALKSNTFLSDFVKTPLLITLLLVAYKSESRVPSNLIDFYRMLFPTLMYRHDGMKIGFNREVRSNIEQSKLEEVFQTFCFLSAQSQLVTFRADNFLSLLEEVNRYSDICLDRKEAENIKHDIVKVTCLIVEDGFEQYSFLHKSIQEYFAATFLEKSGEEVIANFYEKLLEDFRVYQVWSQTALFLSGLNEYLYLKYFQQPLNFMFIAKSSNKFKRAGFSKLIGDSSRVILSDEAEVNFINIQNGYFLVMDHVLTELVLEAIQTIIKVNQIRIRDYIEDCKVSSYEGFHKGPDENVFYLRDLFEEFELWTETLNCLNKKAETRLRTIKKQSAIQLEKFEDRKDLMKKIRIID